MVVEKDQRDQTITLCRTKGARGFQTTYPSEWTPTRVLNSETGLPFSDWSAWDYIARLLEAGHRVQEIILQIPPGKIGYVMQVAQPDGREIYIKWMNGPRGIIGRSFHYSYR